MRKPQFVLRFSSPWRSLCWLPRFFPSSGHSKPRPPPDQPLRIRLGPTSRRISPMTTLKVNVDVVQLFFNVKDKKNGLISESDQGRL